jgi:hypothetical protein
VAKGVRQERPAAEHLAAAEDLRRRTGLPVCDPLLDGADAVVEALVRLHPALRAPARSR